MTLCIAAKSNNSVIGIADTRVSYGTVGFPREKSKLRKMSPTVFALVSGNLGVCHAILDRMTGLGTVCQVAGEFADLRDQRFRAEFAAQTIGLQLPETSVELIRKEVYRQEIDVLFIGMDGSEPSIYTVASVGMPTQCGSIGSESVGSGKVMGDRFLYGYNAKQDQSQVVRRVYMAKQLAAHYLSDVGYESDMVILDESGYREFADRDELIVKLKDVFDEVSKAWEDCLSKQRQDIADELTKKSISS